MAHVTATVQVTIPDDAQVGDYFDLVGDARIVMIRDPQIDITSVGGKTQTIRGEREYELQILNAKLRPISVLEQTLRG